jgi:aspartate carbamoyltransferase catalytic subunit
VNQLLSINDLSASDIEGLLELATSFAEVQKRSVPKVPALRGKTVVMAFFEDSTRTRSSFDIAARRLSADVATFAAGASSLSKGESLRDTVETITAMGVDAIVVRHPHPGVPLAISRYTTASVVNAGDGRHQHPTQALLDAYTLRNALGDIKDRRILLCGDILNSRVARSNVALFTKLGAEVFVCGPGTLVPPTMDGEMFGHPVTVVTDLDQVIETVDVAYMLRIQKERIAESVLPSLREYRTVYGLTAARARRMAPHAVVMHPGPMNRGVEIDAEVADSERSLVTQQVASGVVVRMAVLYQLLGPGRFDAGPDLTADDQALVEDLNLADTENLDAEPNQTASPATNQMEGIG